MSDCECVAHMQVYKRTWELETHEKKSEISKHIEWEDQAFKHGNGKSARETSSTQLLLLFYSSYYSEGCCAFYPCVSFSSYYWYRFTLNYTDDAKTSMTLLSYLLVFYY